MTWNSLLGKEIAVSAAVFGRVPYKRAVPARRPSSPSSPTPLPSIGYHDKPVVRCLLYGLGPIATFGKKEVDEAVESSDECICDPRELRSSS
jgi:hypothetical protein